MPELDYLAIDGDNHFYEPDDCCTRHLDAKYKDRSVHVVRGDDGQGQWFFGSKPFTFHRGARDYVMKPGQYRAFMAGASFDPSAPPEMVPSRFPEYADRDVRLEVMDRQGLEACIMLPSFGVAFEAECVSDPEAACAAVSAFNRWVEDDWGYAYRNRIFTPASISLLDRDMAVAELERVLALGARSLCLRAGPLNRISPADPHFDPFWARVNEAEIPVILHIGVSGYNPIVGAMWGENPDVSETEMTPFLYYTCFGQRPILDTIACFIFHNLFGRFPKLRMLSIENGSTWVPGLLKDLDKSGRVTVSTQGDKRVEHVGGPLREMPSDVFKRHFWVCPFFEDPVLELVETIGAEHVIFGSDWPHPEGVTEPLDFLDECAGLTDAQLRLVMRDNNERLLGLA
ncbi:MAG TPA: amidohydrolase family protein [Myxococcota bacterium]|nr:amidohydrolase [Myxococcales bacterium]HPG25937.1 amidohydrolase family protein [Myxococcota bacterium]